MDKAIVRRLEEMISDLTLNVERGGDYRVLDLVQRVLKFHQESMLLRQKVQQILQDEQALSGMSRQDILMLKRILLDLRPAIVVAMEAADPNPQPDPVPQPNPDPVPQPHPDPQRRGGHTFE